MAKQFFIRQASIEKIATDVDTLHQKIDALTSQNMALARAAAFSQAGEGKTAVYSPAVYTDSDAATTASVVAEEQPMYIPKARIGKASLKKVKTTTDAHDASEVEALKEKRK